MPSNTKISLEKLHLETASGDLIFEDLSFSIKKHSFVSIIGPKDCGTTALLKSVVGLKKPTSGSIIIGGETVEGPNEKTTMFASITPVFEWKTVKDNILFSLKCRNLSKEEQREKLNFYLDLFELQKIKDVLPNQLSTGMQRWVGLARTFASDSRCIVIDEPFVGIDSQLRGRLQEQLLNIWRKTETKTVIMATHNIEEAVFLSDRVMVMSQKPSEIIADIAIDLPRPRTVPLKFKKPFRDFVEHLWRILPPQTDLS